MKPNQPQHPTEFATKDIYLGSILKQAGIPIVRVENHSGRGIFIFQASEEIPELIKRYFNGALKVDPQALFESWKSLKSMAFSAIGDVR